jgi:hypothetical protein
MDMRFVYVRWWRGVYLRRKQLEAWYWIQRGFLCSACLSAFPFPVNWRSTGPFSTKLSRFLQPPANWSYESDGLQIFVDSKQNFQLPIPVATRSKSWVCGRSLVGIAGSNTARGHGCLSVIRQRALFRADHSPRGVLQCVVCLSVIVKTLRWGGRGPVGVVVP